jgi:hypothetical protein
MIDWRKSGEAALKKRLQQAQSEGELRAEIQPADFARYLSLVMAGLGVQPPTGQQGQSCEVSLRSLCSALEPPFPRQEPGKPSVRNSSVLLAGIEGAELHRFCKR